MELAMTNAFLSKLPSAVTVVTSMLVTLTTGAVAQTAPPNFPAAVLCYIPQDKSWRVGYLNAIGANGDAVYMGLGGRLGTTVNAKGVVVAPTNRQAAADCYGKTLDELRSNGRIMEFQRTK
jgi:hypothetical protein